MKILIVEDLAFSQTILKKILNKAGYDQIDIVGDGFEAVMACGDKEYDIILMDNDMPGIQGVNALKNLRASGNNTPVIMVSVESQQERIEHAMNSGANGYHVKPIHAKSLLKTMRDILEKASC